MTPADLRALLEADPSEYRDDSEDTEFDKAFRAGVKYLKSIGFSDKLQLIRVLDICMNPLSAFTVQTYQYNGEVRVLSVEEDIKPVVELLKELGLE